MVCYTAPVPVSFNPGFLWDKKTWGSPALSSLACVQRSATGGLGAAEATDLDQILLLAAPVPFPAQGDHLRPGPGIPLDLRSSQYP